MNVMSLFLTLTKFLTSSVSISGVKQLGITTLNEFIKRKKGKKTADPTKCVKIEETHEHGNLH